MPLNRPLSATEEGEIKSVIGILDDAIKKHSLDLDKMRIKLGMAEFEMSLNPALFDPIKKAYTHLFHARISALLGGSTVVDKVKETKEAEALLTDLRQKLEDVLNPPVFDEDDVKNLVEKVIKTKNLYDPNSRQRNAESVVLQKLMMSVDPRIFPRLSAFIRNPGAALSERLVALAEISDVELRDQIQSREEEIKTHNALIETTKVQLGSNSRLITGERDKLVGDMKGALDAKAKLEREITDRKMVLEHQSSGFEYGSVDQLIYMVQAFIDKDAGRIVSPEGIEAKVDELIKSEAEKVYKGVKEKSAISLELTFVSLSQGDEVFKTIGKDSMKAFAQMESVSDVKAWQKKIETEAKIDPEYNRKTVLPRLIGILELSLNHKGIRRIKEKDRERAARLLASCKEIRRGYIEDEMKGKNYKSGIEKAAAYSTIKATFTDKDVTNKFREWARTRAVKNKLSKLVDWDNSLTVKAYRASSDETKAKIKKLGLGAGVRAAAGIGLLAGASLLGAPLAIAAAGPFYKELITKNNANRAIDIAKGGSGLLFAGLLGGLPLLNANFRGAVFGSLGQGFRRPDFLTQPSAAANSSSYTPAPQKIEEKKAA